jgi:hypothetical protein
MDKNVYMFSDNLVATVAQLLQLAILTGTDVYDHLRTLQVVDDPDGRLVVSPAYQERLDAEVARLLQKAEAAAEAGGFGLETS